MNNDKIRMVLLSIFADGQSHSFYEACHMGIFLLRKTKRTKRELWSLFSKLLLAPDLVRRQYNSWSPHLDTYKLTSLGDECFRETQISLLKRRTGTEEDIRHFKYFNRDNPRLGKMGVIFEGENLDAKAAGLREKYPDLYRDMYI
jgi:hypothetical protein